MLININIFFTVSQKVKSLFYRFFAPSLSTNINSFCATLLPQYHRSLTSFSHSSCCCFCGTTFALAIALLFMANCDSYGHELSAAQQNCDSHHYNYLHSKLQVIQIDIHIHIHNLLFLLLLMLLHHLIDVVCGLRKLSPQQCYVFLFPSSLLVLFRLLSQVLRIFPFTLCLRKQTNKSRGAPLATTYIRARSRAEQSRRRGGWFGTLALMSMVQWLYGQCTSQN